MPDTQPTATVAGQSIALHITGYPDLPNRWGSGHIRPVSIRLDYGNSRTPDGRHALVTGLWVRKDGEATDQPIDRLYDAHNGDTSDWPDWLAELVKAHDPAVVPVSSPPPNQTDLRDRIAEALDSLKGTVHHLAPKTQQAVQEAVMAALAAAPSPGQALAERIAAAAIRLGHPRWDADDLAAAVLAVLPPPADRAAVLSEAAAFAEETAEKLRAHHEFERSTGALDVMTELRRLAAEAQQPDTEKAADTQTWPLIKGNCPACRKASLFLGTGGYPTCSNADCPEPDAATTVLEQYAHEAHPPTHAWRVETRDPGNGQWTPGSHFTHRPNAIQRRDTANRTAPLWHDGTPVERRIVRETTTYTVDQAASPAEESGGV